MDKPLDILLMHPGASWSTHDVYAGLRYGLTVHGCQTGVYQLDARIQRSAEWMMYNWEQAKLPEDQKPSSRDIQYHAAAPILYRAIRTKPDWVFIISGMYVDVEIMAALKTCGFKTAILLTESPYDDDAQVEVLQYFDAVFTNERLSAAKFKAKHPNAHYVAHAWSPLVHTPQEPAALAGIPESDVLFIGTGFVERNAFLNKVAWGQAASGNAELSLYGHWTDLDGYASLKPALRGKTVDNPLASKLYQRARVNLNLHRTSKGATADGSIHVHHAESLNPRCYELAACGAFFMTDARKELYDVFGFTVPTFDSPETLTEQLRFYRDRPDARSKIAKRAHEAVQVHNWVSRARQVLDVLLSS